MEIRVFIADDHRMVRDGIKLILGHCSNMKVVGEAGNGIEAINQCIELEPDVVIMDIGMPMLNGIEAAYRLQKNRPSTKVIALSMYSDDQTVLAALRSGVSGFILKEEAGEEVIKAILQVVEGNAYLSPQVSSILINDFRTKEGFSDNDQKRLTNLTSQERQILQLIAEGHKTKDIAELLFISIQTVRSHRKKIMAKLDIHHVAGLTQYAITNGLAGR